MISLCMAFIDHLRSTNSAASQSSSSGCDGLPARVPPLRVGLRKHDSNLVVADFDSLFRVRCQRLLLRCACLGFQLQDSLGCGIELSDLGVAQPVAVWRLDVADLLADKPQLVLAA